MIKNKFSIYVIENCLSLLIKINENYYINSIKNNLGNSYNSRKNSYKSKKDEISSESEDEESKFKEKKIDGENDDDYSYQKFCELKIKIFQFIENNSAAKEKKKILSLIKANKYKK